MNKKLHILSHDNRLFFPSLAAGTGAFLLVLWLIKKTNQNMTQEDLGRVAPRLKGANLQDWCQSMPDVFNPANEGFLVFGEPNRQQLKHIFDI